MSNKTEATKRATQQSKKIRKAVSDNLVELNERADSRTNPGELNRKIGQIDADLDQLRDTLTSTNQGLLEKLSQLNDKDTDLRSKVTEAYQQLGQLDSDYRSLTSQSSGISREIKAVAKQIKEVGEKSDGQFDSLSEEYQALVNRIEDLFSKSKQTTRDLNKSIKANTKAMQELEQKLLSEIDELANLSRERDETLNQKTLALAVSLDKADHEIRTSQARILKMQAIDQALENRTAALEASAEELTKRSRELSRSTTTLHKQTQALSEALAELQATSEIHTAQIADLRDAGEKTASALLTLVLREKNHFRLLGLSLLILLALFSAYLLYNQLNWRNEGATNNQLQTGIGQMNQHLSATGQQVDGLASDLAALRQSNQGTDTEQSQAITAINQKLSAIGDQVDSLDGRVTNLRPNRGFGSDNTIHGPEWVMGLSQDGYLVHLSTLQNKQESYKLAERYNHYFKKDLAYLPVQVRDTQRYALLYGPFASESEANSALASMPRAINGQTPTLYPTRQIQEYRNNNTK
ncbi:MAG: SPOR domain-containing protein [Candidatus Thiodiazotropha sp.]